MHWKKNRIVNPDAKAEIVQHGLCPGCGIAVKFYYCENIGQFCPDCRKEATAEWADEVTEKRRNR
jgi:hypothetical protein